MATFETFQDLKDTCDELETLCGEVKEPETRKTLLMAAERFQKIAEAMEGNYWKANEKYMERTTVYIRKFIDRVKEIIKYENGNAS
jgi:hypothetical protein